MRFKSKSFDDCILLLLSCPQFPPLFIFAMWANFATSLNVSFDFIHKAPFPWVPAILGLIFGPFTYFSGANMGALALPENSLPFYTLIAIEWAVTLPLLVKFSSRISPKSVREPNEDLV